MGKKSHDVFLGMHTFVIESSKSYLSIILFEIEATGLELGESTALHAPIFISSAGKAQDSSHSSSRGSTELLTLSCDTNHLCIPFCMTHDIACPQTFFFSKVCGSPD